MQTKDFKGQDLRGKSFKNQDLTGADFSGKDLTGAKFCKTKMGRTLKYCFSLLLLQLLLGGFAGSIAAMGNIFVIAVTREFLEKLLISIASVNLIIFIAVYCLLFAAITLISLNRKSLNYILCFFIFVIAGVFVITVAEGRVGGKDIAVAMFGVVTGIGANVVAIAVVSMLAATEILSVIAIITGAVIVTGLLAIGLIINGSNAGVAPAIGAISGLMHIIFGIYLGKLAIKNEDPQLLWLRNPSLKLNSIGYTQFTNAILKNVDFTDTNLKYARFKNAKISNCNFHQTRNHHLALFENTSLAPRKVRDLVIDGIITDKNFATLDLRGLDFSNLNLQDFDFNHANLSGANLSHTQLTGATLEGWNIDTETRLDDIDCRYYYYLENGAKKRMPPEGEEYGAGEFTRIFQKIANTIDFIAHNEMELAAIKLSVEQVRVESGNDDIRVQAIEEKDGFIVVKVTVPKTEDKGVLYHEVNILKQDYEAKIQGLMAEKHIQIGKIDVLKEQLKEQRDDFLAAIKEGKIINTTNYVEGNMSGGNMAGHDMVISTEAELRKI